VKADLAGANLEAANLVRANLEGGADGAAAAAPVVGLDSSPSI
jgi:uncharacterized protein YjbI with pentapeptide repeats